MLLAGAIVLAFPLSPEAVAWSSGVFDVMATTFMLTGILVARQYGSVASVRRRVALYACAALAVLSKETGAVLPLLIMLDMWAGRRWSPILAVDACCLLGIVIAVGTVRLSWAGPMMKQPITKFTVQRWLFGTFGSAAFPWHMNVVHERPLTVLISTLACISVMTAFFVAHAAPEQTRAVIMMACLMAVGTLPVMSILGVAPDLQGARYLYLPSIGWAGLLACIASSGRLCWRSRTAALGGAVLIATYVATLPSHLMPWRRAGELRDRVERAVVTNPLMTICLTIHVAGLPDNIDGAYVFRNGASEAFRRDVGKGLSPMATGECSFAWDDKGDDFVPTTR
jgi:hypothetical protein